MNIQSAVRQRLIRDIVNPRPFLFWHVSDKRTLSEHVIIEAVLNSGDFDDFRRLCDILGIHRVARVFDRLSRSPRPNLKPRTIHFFRLYFDRHVPGYSES